MGGTFVTVCTNPILQSFSLAYISRNSPTRDRKLCATVPLNARNLMLEPLQRQKTQQKSQQELDTMLQPLVGQNYSESMCHAVTSRPFFCPILGWMNNPFTLGLNVAVVKRYRDEMCSSKMLQRQNFAVVKHYRDKMLQW